MRIEHNFKIILRLFENGNSFLWKQNNKPKLSSHTFSVSTETETSALNETWKWNGKQQSSKY